MALDPRKTGMTPGLWRRLWHDLRLLAALLRDYWRGNYRQVPALSMTALGLTLVYILCPVDLISDLIPLGGQLDDALLLAGCLFFIEKDLRRYEEWKSQRSSQGKG